MGVWMSRVVWSVVIVVGAVAVTAFVVAVGAVVVVAVREMAS